MSNPCGVPTNIEERIPPGLRKSLTGLLGHEAEILRQLNSNPDLAQTFITDPGAALARMGVALDPALGAALKGGSRSNPFAPKTYKLPDGRSITPSIKVAFVGHTTTTTAASSARSTGTAAKKRSE